MKILKSFIAFSSCFLAVEIALWNLTSIDLVEMLYIGWFISFCGTLIYTLKEEEREENEYK